MAVDRIAGELATTGRVAGGWADAAEREGIVWASRVSATAHQQFRADYEITFDDGSKVLLGPHLKRGAATGPVGHYRAYFQIDGTEVLLGYVGPHLRDSTTH